MARAADRPRTFDDVVGRADEPVRETARMLRHLVLEADPRLDEGIYGGAKSGMALYSSGGPTRVVCGIQPSAGRCLFYLHRITADDVPGLTLAGKGKHARHIAFTAPATVPAETITRVVQLAVSRLP